MWLSSKNMRQGAKKHHRMAYIYYKKLGARGILCFINHQSGISFINSGVISVENDIVGFGMEFEETWPFDRDVRIIQCKIFTNDERAIKRFLFIHFYFFFEFIYT